jgi:hypothetical protein
MTPQDLDNVAQEGLGRNMQTLAHPSPNASLRCSHEPSTQEQEAPSSPARQGNALEYAAIILELWITN